MDKTAGQIPESMSGQLVASTSSCVAVGTLSEHDGATTLRLVSSSDDPIPGDLVYEGFLATPSREIAICSVALVPFLITPTHGDTTKIQVWANDNREPDMIVVRVE